MGGPDQLCWRAERREFSRDYLDPGFFVLSSNESVFNKSIIADIIDKSVLLDLTQEKSVLLDLTQEKIRLGKLKNLKIKGFKKFRDFSIDFNPNVSIIVGENEAGKSTILDAIEILLNQKYKNSDKGILKDFFNSEDVKNFETNPVWANLPIILIEGTLDLYGGKSSDFKGELYGDLSKSKIDRFGIRFECKPDENFKDVLTASIEKGHIPYEYYRMTWTTFSGKAYGLMMKPFKSLTIDNTHSESASTFNNYSKALFNSVYDEDTRIAAKNIFRQKLENSLADTNLPPLSEERRFGLNTKKVPLEGVISVYENSIPLENRGSGMENLIKTKIALDKSSNLDLVLLEEPESHLCFSSLRKMLFKIQEQIEDSQLIIATHENLIATSLNLRNVIWINENEAFSLSDVSPDTADFFVKASHNCFLQLLLSKNAILVEGPTELLMVPYFYEKEFGKHLETDEITLLSCDGLSYERYLEIGHLTNKRIAVLTDNDENNDKIRESTEFNKLHKKQHVFMGKSIEDWTWEACLFHSPGNKEILDNAITSDPKAKYEHKGKAWPGTLGKMMKDKVPTAYYIITHNLDLQCPSYLQECFEWLKE